MTTLAPGPITLAHPATVLISSTVIRGITVEIRRDSDDVLFGVTLAEGERLEWDHIVDTGEQVRELAAMALAHVRHGADGRRSSLPIYESVGGGR